MSGYYRLFLAAVVAGLCLRESGSTQPSLFILSPDLKAFFGEQVVLSCSCVNNDHFEVLEWLHDGERLSISDPANCQPPSPFLLSLEGVQSADAGQYTCKGNTSDGAINHDVVMLSVYDPSIFIAPPKQYAIINTTTTLNCTTIPTYTSVFVATWGNETTNPIDNRRAQLEDEGTYTCDMYIYGDVYAGMVKEIEFFVIVPPLITAKPNPYEAITGNSSHTLTVEFQSRLQENTSVTWYKDGDTIPEGEIQTVYSDDGLNAYTQLIFVAVTRSDRGVYRVVIENNNDIIPIDQSRREANFQLNVTVLPAIPDNVKVTNTTPGKVKITWSVTNQNADEAADSLTVTLQYSDRTLFKEYMLSGDETEVSVDVEPGMDYWVSVSAHNPDGTKTSTATPFHSPSIVPSISSVEVERLNMTAFSLTVTLEYTGGGDITTFTVSFRESGTTEWNTIEVIATQSDSDLELNGVVVTEKFRMGHMEFQVTVRNEFGLLSHAEIEETMFLPGAPTDIILISSTTDALNIEVHLSPEGTPPLREIVVDFKSPPRPEMRYTSHEPSDDVVQLTLTPLEENTEYNFSVYVINEVGSGPHSETFTFSTDKEDNSLPLWIFIVTAVAGFIILLILLLIIVMVTVRGCQVQAQKREYSITNPISTSADDKNLDPSHEMINRQHKQSFPTIAGVPLTPRGHGTAEEGLTSYGSGSRFKFETASSSGVSSSGNSNTQESEESEANCPRYTYNISPSPGQSFHSLQMQPRVTNLHYSLHGTRESIITCPPAPTPNSTNV